MGICFLRQMLFGFAKVCVGDFKTVLQVVRIQSLEDYCKAPFSKRFKCQIATKGYKKTAECSAVW